MNPYHQTARELLAQRTIERDSAHNELYFMRWLALGLVLALIYAAATRHPVRPCPAPPARDTLHLDSTEVRAPGVWI